ncbi:MAG: hypothetical protein HUK06_08970 [Bacteroidaceae bacterium]|nr:hypothetical protein [Bacteroidaceae bacterium]
MKILTAILIASLFFAGCTKYNLDDDNIIGEGDSRLTLTISPFETGDFGINPASRIGINEVCTRIGFAVFDANNKKVASANQNVKDAGFGTISANISNGVYDVVIVAHSTGGNTTIAKPDSIRFADNKLSDIFTYHEKITVNGNVSKQITMKRSVAMFRLVLEERIPTEVKQLKFYYTGGSSALNAVTNLGKINSRQTEIIDVPQEAYTQSSNIFEVYTIPHEINDALKMTVTGLGADGSTIIAEKIFEEVPVTQGKITIYKGIMFDGNSGASESPFSLSLTTNDVWTEQTYNF